MKKYFFLLLLVLFIGELYREFSHDPQDFSDIARRIAGNIWLTPYHDYWGPTTDSTIFTSQNFNHIPIKILEYRNNDTLIVVKQKGKQSAPYDSYAKKINYPYSKDSIYYWLIIVPVDSFIGPLTYDSISTLYNLNNVDESLRL